MALSGSLTEQLSELLSRHRGTVIDIEQADPVAGGSINDAYRLRTNEGSFFLKVNSSDRFPSMFEAEADGLRRLRSARALRVPEVIALGEDHDDSFLLLEFVENGTRDQRFSETLAQGLAALHRNTSGTFGLERDNYIGSLVQRNTPSFTWVDFFIHSRLEPQVGMAVDHQRLGRAAALRFERLYARLEQLLPTEAPALLHGDLWSGNVMCHISGAPVILDPAVYYGHREMDLAMTRLFGGFEEHFVAAYHAAYPLSPDWEDRIDLCNLYPLLVHVNLFGGGYAAQVEGILRRFAGG